MPNRPPSYRYHNTRNCAVVTLGGKDYYPGPYDSPESCEKYHRLIAEWFAGNRRSISPIATPSAFTINHVILAYWRHVQSYYVKDGNPALVQARP